MNPIDWIVDLFDADRAILARNLLQLVVIWVFAWFAYRLVGLVARRLESRVDDGDDSTMSAEEKRGKTIAQLVRSVGRAILLIGVVLSSLNLFIDIKPLLAGVGILSLAVSFGAQSLVKDFIAGFFILFENQFVVGDVIQIGDKSGSVERMTLRVVVLRDVQGAVHIVPNGTITSVTNMTRGWSRAVVDITIGYRANLDEALAVVRDELSRFRVDRAWEHRLDGTSEVVGIQTLNEHGIVIRTLIRTVPGAQWEAAREFHRRLKNRLDAEGIEIPFPKGAERLRGPTDKPAT